MSTDLTRAKMEADSIVGSLQAKIRALISEIFGVENLKKKQSEKVAKLRDSLAQAHELLMTEVEIAFPGQGVNITNLADILPDSHPLFAKYMAYVSETQELSKAMAEESFILEKLDEAEKVKGAEMLNTVSSYQQFHSMSADLDTESPDDFFSKLMIEQQLPMAEISQLRAFQEHVTGMDLVNTDARAYVTQYLAQGKALPSTTKKRALTWTLVGSGLLLLFL